MEAHMLREHIDGQVRSFIRDLSKGRVDRDLKAAVVQLAGILNAHHAAKTIPDVQHNRVSACFPKWCEQIWRIFEPAVVKELIGQCPNPDCEQSAHVDELGMKGSALIAFYVRGTESVRAKCRACGWLWDQGQLRLLGEWLGATQDDDFLLAAGL